MEYRGYPVVEGFRGGGGYKGIPCGKWRALHVVQDQDPRVPAGLLSMSRFLQVVSVAEAAGVVVQIAPAPVAETAPVERSAGRVLAAPVAADTDIPGFDRSVVDGCAVRAQDTTGAGDSVPALLQSMGRVSMGTGDGKIIVRAGGCAYIPTGGVLPAGADAVVMVEYTEEAGDTILEIGCGSGYQAAVLSRLVKQVHSLEIIPELAAAATGRLESLGYRNVAVHCADGHDGWPAHAPYDGIIVTAAAPVVPPALAAQLRPGTRLVMPVGRPGGFQELMVLEKRADGGIDAREVLGVSFVPLTGRRCDAD